MMSCPFAWPNQAQLNQTKPNQTKPNQTKPNQPKPNQTKVKVEGVTGESTVNLKYENVYHVGIGAQYQYSSKWRYSAGLSYDSALSKGKHRSAMIPMGEMTRFGGGVEYRKRSDLTLGTAMDIMWEGDLSLNSESDGGTLSGAYEDVFLAFCTVYAKWQ